MINISIIIPNFNGANNLSECLKHLNLALTNCPETKFEIILVDNASTDKSLKVFSSLVTSHSQLIANPSNLGFAHAVNQGILAAKYEYVCLLNNDVKLDKNWFKLISKNIKTNPKIACFCGTLLNKDGSKIESQGISFSWSGKCLQIKHNQSYLKSSFSNLDSIPVWGSSGAAVIYNKKIIKDIGLFDPHYFAYIEDVDMAFRLQKNGYKTLLNPLALAYHQGGATSNKMGNFRAKQTFKNWIYFISKNYTRKELIINLPRIFIERLRNLSYLLKSSINK